MVVGEEVIVRNVRRRTEAEVKTDAVRTDHSLREALTVYRDRNIGEGLNNSVACILSNRLINVLVQKRPESRLEWQQAIPLRIRDLLDRGQLQHLDGIIEVIGEHLA